MKVIHKIYVDFCRQGVPAKIDVKQNDRNSRTIAIIPLDDRKTIKIPDGVTAELRMTKADDSCVICACDIDENGIIIAELSELCVNISGNMTAEVVLLENEKILSSQCFEINVLQSAYSELKDNTAVIKTEALNEIRADIITVLLQIYTEYKIENVPNFEEMSIEELVEAVGNLAVVSDDDLELVAAAQAGIDTIYNYFGGITNA